MKKSNMLFIIYLCFITSVFMSDKDVYLVCSVIIVVGMFIVKQLEENNQNK